MFHHRGHSERNQSYRFLLCALCGELFSSLPLRARPPAAVGAARHWTFSPTTLNGEPVRIVGTITFNFRSM